MVQGGLGPQVYGGPKLRRVAKLAFLWVIVDQKSIKKQGKLIKNSSRAAGGQRRAGGEVFFNSFFRFF